MISANDLRKTKLSPEQNGYSVDEVNAVLNEAAQTIDGYVNENKELYRKMEVLAKRIEEYREEEDSIKSALITAQKMADKIQKESNETASLLITKSEETAKQTLSEANEKAEKIVNEAREYSSNLIKEKTEEADSIVASAEKKANEAISSSKIVAQDILDQAKQISEDLIAKSKAESEAYSILTEKIKGDAKEFISKLVSLYDEQLDALKNANLETSKESEEKQEVDSIHDEVNSLVSEIEEIQISIPQEVVIEEAENEEEPVEISEEEPQEEPEEFEEEEIEVIDDEEPEDEGEAEFEITEEEVSEDPMKAVEAFSQNEITPIYTSSVNIPEIDEEAAMEDEDKSLFDDDSSQLPFETYFNVNKEDAHLDRTQTISLVPPEDDDEPKFKGFFKKKK